MSTFKASSRENQRAAIRVLMDEEQEQEDEEAEAEAEREDEQAQVKTRTKTKTKRRIRAREQPTLKPARISHDSSSSSPIKMRRRRVAIDWIAADALVLVWLAQLLWLTSGEAQVGSWAKADESPTSARLDAMVSFVMLARHEPNDMNALPLDCIGALCSDADDDAASRRELLRLAPEIATVIIISHAC